MTEVIDEGPDRRMHDRAAGQVHQDLHVGLDRDATNWTTGGRPGRAQRVQQLARQGGGLGYREVGDVLQADRFALDQRVVVGHHEHTFLLGKRRPDDDIVIVEPQTHREQVDVAPAQASRPRSV